MHAGYLGEVCTTLCVVLECQPARCTVLQCIALSYSRTVLGLLAFIVLCASCAALLVSLSMIRHSCPVVLLLACSYMHGRATALQHAGAWCGCGWVVGPLHWVPARQLYTTAVCIIMALVRLMTGCALADATSELLLTACDAV